MLFICGKIRCSKKYPALTGTLFFYIVLPLYKNLFLKSIVLILPIWSLFTSISVAYSNSHLIFFSQIDALNVKETVSTRVKGAFVIQNENPSCFKVLDFALASSHGH